MPQAVGWEGKPWAELHQLHCVVPTNLRSRPRVPLSRAQRLQLHLSEYTLQIGCLWHRIAEDALGIHNWCPRNNTFCSKKKTKAKTTVMSQYMTPKRSQ